VHCKICVLPILRVSCVLLCGPESPASFLISSTPEISKARKTNNSPFSPYKLRSFHLCRHIFLHSLGLVFPHRRGLTNFHTEAWSREAITH
jgi:hypothetical protein